MHENLILDLDTCHKINCGSYSALFCLFPKIFIENMPLPQKKNMKQHRTKKLNKKCYVKNTHDLKQKILLKNFLRIKIPSLVFVFFICV